jgi:hypothetical protein
MHPEQSASNRLTALEARLDQAERAARTSRNYARLSLGLCATLLAAGFLLVARPARTQQGGFDRAALAKALYEQSQYRQSGGVSAQAARVVIKKQKAPFQIVNSAGQVLTHTDQFTLNGNLESRLLLTNPHQNSSYTGSISMHGSGLNGGATFVYDEQGRTLGAMAATTTGGVFFLWDTNGNATFAAP